MRVSPSDLKATLAALFVLKYLLRQCPLSLVTNHVESRYQSKETDAVVLCLPLCLIKSKQSLP